MFSEQGFTLLEMSITILILGILAAIAVPMYLQQRVAGSDANVKTVATTTYTVADYAFTNAPATTHSIQDLMMIPNPSNVTVGLVLDSQRGPKNYCIVAYKAGSSFTAEQPLVIYKGDQVDSCPLGISATTSWR